MKQQRLKRIKVDKHGTFIPQYKYLFFWRTYRNSKGKKEHYGDLWDAKQFLRSKDYQDLERIRHYNEQGIINWPIKDDK